MEAEESRVEFWEARWREGQTGWDLGQASPPFEALLEGPDPPAPGRLAVVGCGRGHDALLFARRGFEAIGFDFAPSAVAAARALAAEQGVAARFEVADFFELPRQWAGQFDCVIENSFFTAIAPTRRAEYADVVAALLRPGGELIGLFRDHDRPDGPPYGTSESELRRLLAGAFEVVAVGPAPRSHERRQGEELLVRARRR
jgi:SAM-dependent methyltransferase